MVTFGVLGPVTAGTGGGPSPLKGPRHRAVLARLLVARGRVVPVGRLVDDLWEDPAGWRGRAPSAPSSPPAPGAGARPPARQPARLLVTERPGYALRRRPGRRGRLAVRGGGRRRGRRDADCPRRRWPRSTRRWRCGAAPRTPTSRGPWARRGASPAGRTAAARRRTAGRGALALGRPDEQPPTCPPTSRAIHCARTPGGCCAPALYRTGRQGDALAVLREAREVLVAELGLDPGPELRRLEADILAQAPHLTRNPAEAANLVRPVRPAGRVRNRSGRSSAGTRSWSGCGAQPRPAPVPAGPRSPCSAENRAPARPRSRGVDPDARRAGLGHGVGPQPGVRGRPGRLAVDAVHRRARLTRRRATRGLGRVRRRV